jgi:hypothetical protein
MLKISGESMGMVPAGGWLVVEKRKKRAAEVEKVRGEN